MPAHHQRVGCWPDTEIITAGMVQCQRTSRRSAMVTRVSLGKSVREPFASVLFTQPRQKRNYATGLAGKHIFRRNVSYWDWKIAAIEQKQPCSANIFSYFLFELMSLYDITKQFHSDKFQIQWPLLTNSIIHQGNTIYTCEEFGDGLVLSACRADEQQPGRQELMVTGQELGNGPGGARWGPLVPLTQLAAFINGVHQQEQRLLGRLHVQEGQKDASGKIRNRKERKRRNVIVFISLMVSDCLDKLSFVFRNNFDRQCLCNSRILCC